MPSYIVTLRKNVPGRKQTEQIRVVASSIDDVPAELRSKAEVLNIVREEQNAKPLYGSYRDSKRT